MRRLSLVLAFSALLGTNACSDDSPVFVIQQDAFGDGSVGGDTGGEDGIDPDAGTLDVVDNDGVDPDGVDPDGVTPDGVDPDAGGEDGVDPDGGGPDATPTEVCDDGVDNDGDGQADCDDADCADQLACGGSCGDGTLDDGEECDDGGANSDTARDACRTTCMAAGCGDRVVDTGEACDEGANNGFGRCNLACQVQPVCGDRVVDAPETCDDGNDNPADGCDNCQLTTEPACGDGFFTPGAEECDSGQGCGVDGVCEDDCTCTFFECGNGVLEGAEECDGVAAGCGTTGFCGPACTCIDFVCGNNRLEPGEECDGTDSAVCGADEFCNGSCACEAFVCGNGTTEGTEECDGTGCVSGELCTETCECQPAQVCGNDVREGTEECDGTSGCPAGSACDELCMCVSFECGNGIVEGAEQCDGSAASCGTGETCSAECACVGPPVLDTFPSDPLSGPAPALILHPNRTDEFCDDFLTPHGYEIVVSGASSGPLTGATVLTPEGTVGVETEALSGEFETTLAFCLEQLYEGESFGVAMTNSFGESARRSINIPILEEATLDVPTVFLSRDLNQHVFALTGSAPARNVSDASIDVFIGSSSVQTIVADAWPLFAAYSGGRFSGATVISGVSGVNISRYDVSITTHGGLESTTRTASVPASIASSTGACVPARSSEVATCPEGRWCRQTTSNLTGVCSAATGAAPTLTSVGEAVVEMNSPDCDVDFPNAIEWRMVGNIATVPLLQLRLALSVSAPDGLLLSAPIMVGPLDERRGICFSGSLTGETVTITLIDEAGRESAPRTFIFP